MRGHTVDIIETLINELDFTYTIKSNTNDGTDTTLVVSDTFHSRKGLTVNDGSTDYTIKSVDHDTKTIIISGVVSGVITLQSPFYFHGVPYKVNDNLSKIRLTKNKLPLIYLYEIIREREIRDELSAIEREADIRLFFLDESKYAEWDTDQHYSLAITPMKNLVNLFLENLRDNNKIGLIEDSTIINHANFGTFVTDQGHVSSFFNERTSGVELDITLPILKDLTCST